MKRKRSLALKYVCVDEQKMENKKDIANNINKYFCEVEERLNNEINITDISLKTLPERNNKFF